MDNSPFIFLSDLVDPTDPQGRTVKEINLAKPHVIPIGALVEVGDSKYPDPDDGIRLWVVHYTRDCDGTPLYHLSAERADTMQETKGFKNYSWIGGYSDSSLTVIRWPEEIKS